MSHFIAQHTSGTIYKGFTLSRIDDLLWTHAIDQGSSYDQWLIVESSKEVKERASITLETYHNDGFCRTNMPSKEDAQEYKRAALALK
jgi:hypothetical protein